MNSQMEPSNKSWCAFEGIVHLGEEAHRTEVSLTESDDALLGSELLEGYILEIDYGTHTVEIRKSSVNRQG